MHQAELAPHYAGVPCTQFLGLATDNLAARPHS
jgi:hypothetical protein